MLMSQVTTLGIGGLASEFLVVKSIKQLTQAVKQASRLNKKFLVIGSGSNLLVSDKGVSELVIKNAISGITTSEVSLSTSEVYAKSGTLLQELVDFTIKNGLSGLQNLTGIPGTIGGAIFGNAGAYGQTISDHITSVVILNSLQGLQTLSRNDCHFNYRDSRFKKHKAIILEVTFKLQKSDPRKLKKESDEILNLRLKKYPKDIKCPGSFFKNIVADSLPKNILAKIPKEKISFGKISAGYLLEAVGANGQRLDGIEIANYHGNLFINKGRGNASDFYKLAKKYYEKVYEKFGIKLEPEVQLINLPPIIE